MTRKKITLERTYEAPLEDVWDMWTTAEGIESWWGPDGFEVKVRSIELRPGGTLLYAMTAVAREQAEFLKKSGMPLTTETRITFTEVTPRTRLAYDNIVDFIPGREPYTAATVVELQPIQGGVRLSLTIEAMHDDHWTQMAVMGWESELGKLAKALASRG